MTSTHTKCIVFGPFYCQWASLWAEYRGLWGDYKLVWMGHCLYELIYHLVMVVRLYRLFQALKLAQWLYGLSHHTLWSHRKWEHTQQNSKTTRKKRPSMFSFNMGDKSSPASDHLTNPFQVVYFNLDLYRTWWRKWNQHSFYECKIRRGGTSCDAMNYYTITPLADHLIFRLIKYVHFTKRQRWQVADEQLHGVSS